LVGDEATGSTKIAYSPVSRVECEKAGNRLDYSILDPSHAR
jgi:hypothetical protein